MSVTHLPFKPIKGEAFVLTILSYSVAASPSTPDTVTISKDNGALTGVDSYTVVGGGLVYVSLTATEMDADVITIVVRDTGGSNTYNATIIYTQTAELAAAPTTASSMSEKLTALWQYFFLKRTITSSTETLLKDDGSTPLATSTVSDDGTTVTHGEIS